MLVRRDEYFAVGGCNPAFRLAEDDDLILRLLMAGSFAAVDEELVGYRRHGGNVTNQTAARRRLASKRVLQLLVWGAESRQDAGAQALLEQNLRRWRRRSAGDTVGLAIAAARSGEWGGAVREISWGLAHSPSAVAESFWSRVRRSERSR